MYIRKAEKKDIQALLDIYNYEVVNGVATLDLEPKTYTEWEAWFAAHNIKIAVNALLTDLPYFLIFN